MALHSAFQQTAKNTAKAAVLALGLGMSSLYGNAAKAGEAEQSPVMLASAPVAATVESEFIRDCAYATCVGMAGSAWSEKNPHGVAVAIVMGQSKKATAEQIMAVLTHDLKANGVQQIKYFVEHDPDNNEAGMTIHVRGGTEGVFTIANVRQQIPTLAKYAVSNDPLLISTL